MSVLQRLIRGEDGQDLAEYGIALLVIAAGTSAAAVLIAGDVETLWTTAQGILATVVAAS